MWVLAVDTARKGIHLALFTLDGSRSYQCQNLAARGEALSQDLANLLQEAGVQWLQVEEVFVTLGPGSFTGLRTGIAFCQGLCATGRRRLRGVSSLALLRLQFNSPGKGNVGVLSPARQGYWYAGIDGEAWPNAVFGGHLSEEEFLSASEAARFLQDCEYIVSDAPCPQDGPLAVLSERWVEVHDCVRLSSLTALLPCITPSLHWKANYLQPSYAEQAPAPKR